MQSSYGTFSIKDTLIFAPLAGYAIAISYEVGTFFGLGSQYFFLFSLSEHLTFALATLPIASIAVLLALATIQWARDKGLVLSSKRERIAIWEIIALCSLLGVGMFLALSNHLAAGTLLMAGTTIWFAYVYARVGIRKSRLLATLYLCASATLGAFAFGVATGMRSQLSIKVSQALERKTGARIEGRLVRSGERGVLFFDSAEHAPIFLRWDDVVAIRGINP